MKIKLYLQDKNSKWLTGEIVKSRDPLGQGNTKWEVSWEGGDFIFYGTKPQLKSQLKKLSDKTNEGFKFLLGGKEI